MRAYSQEFYMNDHDKTIYSANSILSVLLERIPEVRSAVDVGCGLGTWLSVLQERGVEDILGFDGDWVDEALLEIPRACFKSVDLSRSAIKSSQKYDLAISLEVAEHLPADRANEFVSSLTVLSDHVLFSAAIPFQGGRNHVNEQWQHYWVGLFADLGYEVHDFIRPKIWEDANISFWYKQNIFLFVKQLPSDEMPNAGVSSCGSLPLDLVHPDLYLRKTKAQTSLKDNFKRFRR